MTKVAEPASKSQLTYDWLRRRILSREFTPGYRLVLGTVAKELGVSIVPVREAVRRLEAEGLIEFERNVGARVAMVDEAQYIEAMQALGVLEGVATALALPKLSEQDLARAQDVNDRLRALLDDFDPVLFTTTNEKFHRSLFGQCPNTHMLDLVEREWTRLDGLRSSTFSFVPGRAAESVDEHDSILKLIRDRADPDQIERAIRDHRWRTVEAYRD